MALVSILNISKLCYCVFKHMYIKCSNSQSPLIEYVYFGSVIDTIILLIIKTQELFEREMPTAHQNQFN